VRVTWKHILMLTGLPFAGIASLIFPVATDHTDLNLSCLKYRSCRSSWFGLSSRCTDRSDQALGQFMSDLDARQTFGDGRPYTIGDCRNEKSRFESSSYQAVFVSSQIASPDCWSLDSEKGLVRLAAPATN
jgi:hypothetical protein